MSNQLKMAQVESILALYVRGWSQRRIARELGVDRETVARYVGLAASKPAKLPTGSDELAMAGEDPNPAKLPTGSAALDEEKGGSNPAKVPTGLAEGLPAFVGEFLPAQNNNTSAMKFTPEVLRRNLRLGLGIPCSVAPPQSRTPFPQAVSV